MRKAPRKGGAPVFGLEFAQTVVKPHKTQSFTRTKPHTQARIWALPHEAKNSSFRHGCCVQPIQLSQAVVAGASTAPDAMANMSRRMSTSYVAPEESELMKSRLDLPLPQSRIRPREPRRTLGVWSPFGHVFNPHGQVELSLGRKPQPPTALPPPPPPTSGASKLRTKSGPSAADDKGSAALHAIAKQPQMPPVMKRGLGLGLGLQPQRFPRELLKSSEQRLVACHAGHESGLASSLSEPSLPSRADIDGRMSAGDPVRRLFGAAHPGFLDYDDDEPELPADPPAPPASASRRNRFAHGGVAPAAATGRTEKRTENSLRGARELPLGPRCKAEFKEVQREGRLRLQEALAERQRVRDSVLTLRHAQANLGPIVSERQGGRPGGGRGGGGRARWHWREPLRARVRCDYRAHAYA